MDTTHYMPACNMPTLQTWLICQPLYSLKDCLDYLHNQERFRVKNNTLLVCKWPSNFASFLSLSEKILCKIKNSIKIMSNIKLYATSPVK